MGRVGFRLEWVFCGTSDGIPQALLNGDRACSPLLRILVSKPKRPSCSLQRLLGEQLAAFKIQPLALWTNDSFELLVSEEEAAPGAQDDDGELEEVETIDM